MHIAAYRFPYLRRLTSPQRLTPKFDLFMNKGTTACQLTDLEYIFRLQPIPQGVVLRMDRLRLDPLVDALGSDSTRDPRGRLERESESESLGVGDGQKIGFVVCTLDFASSNLFAGGLGVGVASSDIWVRRCGKRVCCSTRKGAWSHTFS